MANDKGGSGARLPLLLLLLGLAAGGAWNYHRNVEREGREDRPLRGYAEADLEKLLAAYQQEAGQAAKRAASTPRAVVASAGGRPLGEAAKEFDRVQRQSVRVRDAHGDLAESELMVERVEQELRRRDQERDRTALFLRRLTTLDF
jgi:hypothetical protein